MMRTLVVGLACVAGAAALRPQPLGRPPVGRPVGRRGEPLRVLADDRVVALGSDELDVVDLGGDEQVAARGGDGLDAETWAAAVDDMAALEKLGDEKRMPSVLLPQGAPPRARQRGRLRAPPRRRGPLLRVRGERLSRPRPRSSTARPCSTARRAASPCGAPWRQNSDRTLRGTRRRHATAS